MTGSIRAFSHAKFHGVKICHLHLFNVGVLEFFNLVLAKCLGLKVVITVHDVEAFAAGLSIPLLSRQAYRIADHIIVHNKASKYELQTLIMDIPEKTSIICHGNYLHVLNKIPSRLEARKRLGINPEAKVLLFFGQIKQVKGLDILIRACIPIFKQNSDYILVVAGRAWKDDLEKYISMIEKNDLTKKILTFFQYIPDSEVSNYFSAADIVVLPYRRIYQSGVLLMAMSYGKPVLASDLDGMKDIIKDGETGFLFPSGNVGALSQTITEIFSEPQKTQRVALNGLRQMEEEFSWTKIGRMTARIYRDLLN
jgi:D-inositol-3-phosphate glycosyltransferase